MVLWNDLRGWLAEVEQIGELVKIEGSEYIYSFSTDELVIITDDQPIEIFFTGKRYKGAYIGKSGNKILVSCSENIGEKIESESSLFLPSSF